VRSGTILRDGTVSTKKLAKHRGRAHKLALESGSSRIFYSCGEDGMVQDVRVSFFQLTSFCNFWFAFSYNIFQSSITYAHPLDDYLRTRVLSCRFENQLYLLRIDDFYES